MNSEKLHIRQKIASDDPHLLVQNLSLLVFSLLEVGRRQVVLRLGDVGIVLAEF